MRRIEAWPDGTRLTFNLDKAVFFDPQSQSTDPLRTPMDNDA